MGMLLASRYLWLMKESISACRVLEKLLSCREASAPSSTLHQEAIALYGWVLVTSEHAGSNNGLDWFEKCEAELQNY